MRHNISISIALMLLVGIIACSDTPHTGSMLTPADVDKYISYSGSGKVCLENDGVSRCVNLAQGNRRINIVIHPQRIVHTFYYKDSVILQTEQQNSNDARDVNNADRPQPNDNTGGESDPIGNTDGDGDDGNDGNVEPPSQMSGDPTDNNEVPDALKTHHAPNGWVVRLYYQDGIPANAETSLEGSGFVVTVFDENDNDITDTIKDEAFIDGEDGNGFQFFVPTTGHRITIRVEGFIADHVAIFIINAQGEIVSTEGTHTYQINPL